MPCSCLDNWEQEISQDTTVGGRIWSGPNTRILQAGVGSNGDRVVNQMWVQVLKLLLRTQVEWIGNIMV